MMRLARCAAAQQLARKCASATAAAPRRAFSDRAPRVFASFGVYKPDHFEISPIPPTFRALQGGAYALKSPGRILLSIAPHDGKTVEWDRKSKFGLSAVEAAQLVDLHNSPEGSVVISRTTEAGSRALEARVDPHENGGVLLFMQEETGGSTLHVSLSKHEFAVVKSIVEYSIPKLCGVDRALDFLSVDFEDSGYGGGGGGGGGGGQGNAGPPAWAFE